MTAPLAISRLLPVRGGSFIHDHSTAALLHHCPPKHEHCRSRAREAMSISTAAAAGDASPARTGADSRLLRMLKSVGWINGAILAGAAFLRLAWLGIKPPHFDEGVNGYFVDAITRVGYYHYDPSNFHGPLHFYILFIAQTLFGRDIAVLRAPLAVTSLACVALTLFGFRRFLSPVSSRIAAVTIAISPGLVFYGRYAIHETWLVLFQMLSVWGIAGLWREGSRRYLWAIGLGLTGMVLTKETWVIHVLAMALAVPTLWLVEQLSPSADFPRAQQDWNARDAARIAAVCGGLVVFFYSGCFLDPSGLLHIGQSYREWFSTGTEGLSGHEKPFTYWWELLATYEWPALFGIAAAAFLLSPRTDRFVRYVAIFGAGTFVAYSIIAYKTPWCLAAMLWPFCFVFGWAIERAAKRYDAWTIGAAALVLCLFSLGKSADLNFRKYAASDDQSDDAEPYVYVQTRRDVNKLLEPLRWLVAQDPAAMHRRGHILQPEHHPLLWMLGDFTRITWDDESGTPEPMDADWLLVDQSAVDRVEEALRGEYFKEPLQLRGMSPDESMLYLRAGTFRRFFPEREPEFAPAEAALLREVEMAQ